MLQPRYLKPFLFYLKDLSESGISFIISLTGIISVLSTLFLYPDNNENSKINFSDLGIGLSYLVKYKIRSSAKRFNLCSLLSMCILDIYLLAASRSLRRTCSGRLSALHSLSLIYYLHEVSIAMSCLCMYAMQ